MKVILSGTPAAASIAKALRMLVDRDSVYLAQHGGDPTEMSQLANDLDGYLPTVRELKLAGRFALVHALLTQHDGNISRCAIQADYGRKEFYGLIESCGLDVDEFRLPVKRRAMHYRRLSDERKQRAQEEASCSTTTG